jgi:DNA polymerase III subunit alpha
MPELVHLHVHSQYSLLDGALKVKDLVKRVSSLGMKGVALTDHGNMFGAISFYKAAKEAGIQAILGCELEVAAGSHSHHLPLLAATAEGYKNLVWLVSRGHVAPDSAQPGGIPPRPQGAPAGLPTVAWDDIASHAKGIIALTGCMGGVMAQSILEEGAEAGARTLARLKETFEPGMLYVELQDHGLPEQPVLNGIARDLAKRLELPVVATNDVHYPEKTDAEAHLYLSCIKTGRSSVEAKENHHGSSEMYLKSPAEMAELFKDHPDAIKATLEIAEKCHLKLKLGEPMLPSFNVPDGYDAESYFRHVAREGLASRFSEFAAVGKRVDEAAYRARLELELDVIAKMNFPGYFLIVWDFIRFAKETGVPVGPGRGSGAGSIVAYSMRITDIDPIPYHLLFERFLNPERVSMPDFDIDFCMDRRDEVIAYVQKKYGETSVGQIATFAELKAKSVIKDVARCIGITPVEAQQIANLIPRKNPAETFTIAESLQVEPKLKARYDTEPVVKELIDQAQKLEGLTRHAAKHAAGIVISEGPLWDHVPVFKDDKSGSYVTQYYKDDVEQAGLVKFDFLGLKTLTVLDIAVRLINARPDFSPGPPPNLPPIQGGGVSVHQVGHPGARVLLPPVSGGGREGGHGVHADSGGGREGGHAPFNLATLPLDDKATFALLASGDTKGVFQLESSGMQQLFKDLRADCFEDIIAAVALYRPGPLGAGMVANFVNRKHGREAIAKMHPLVDELLVPTYGVVVYQEQVMQIAQALAGYSLGGADLLRRAMGKKKPEEMAKQKSVFLEGAKKKGVAEKDAEHIFGLLEYFAGYGFNKSHSAAYALLTYQTAYLKAHYPVELLCAIMTSDKDKIDKVVRTIADARAMGVTVLPPDLNESDTDFKVVYTHPKGDRRVSRGLLKRGAFAFAHVTDPCGPQIRFGLGAVRGVGSAALETLFEARQAGGAFTDLFDFASRVDAKKINKGVLESLVACGALDGTLAAQGVNRARAFASIDIALERSRAASRDREAGQTNLFGLFDAAAPSQKARGSSAGDYAEAPTWDRREMLVRERQALGFYVSGHPLERYAKGPAALSRLEARPVAECSAMADWSVVKLAGMVEGYREKVLREGGKLAFFDLEDLTGRVGVKVRGNAIETYAAVLSKGEPVLLTGKVSFPRRDEDAPGGEEEPEGTREATILLNEVVPLSEAVGRASKAVAIRLDAKTTTKSDIARMAEVLGRAKGACPVTLHLALPDGAEAVMSLGKEFRVEVSDLVLAGLERVFGEQVAELR